MLIEFSVENFLSFKQRATFSMRAAPLRELHPKHIFTAPPDVPLLKTGVLYGANASGKSNLFRAMSFMRGWVRDSAKDTQVDELIPVERFRLSTETDNAPSRFEIVFSLDSVVYRYYFAADTERIHEEWLKREDGTADAQLFLRDSAGIKLNEGFDEGRTLEPKTRPNALFLSVVALFNGPTATAIMSWFQRLRFHLSDEPQLAGIVNELSNPEWKKNFLRYVKVADLSIQDILVEEPQPAPGDPAPNPASSNPSAPVQAYLTRRRRLQPTVRFMHQRYDAQGNIIGLEAFRFQNESAGTQKFLTLLVPILETLRNGSLLVVDELDTRFHTLLVRSIVDLFNSNENQRAQLIFATHSTAMVDRRFFRPDQVWFSEKNRYGATDIYSLVEYDLSEDAFSERDYVQGRYGAIPFLGDFRSLLSMNKED